MAGGVVTYEVGGKQYVAFASGNISRNAFGDLGLPSVVIMTLNADAARRASARGSARAQRRRRRAQSSRAAASCTARSACHAMGPTAT